MITIAPCAVLCRTDAWVEVARVGAADAAWLGVCLALPNGIPS